MLRTRPILILALAFGVLGGGGLFSSLALWHVLMPEGYHPLELLFGGHYLLTAWLLHPLSATAPAMALGLGLGALLGPSRLSRVLGCALLLFSALVLLSLVILPNPVGESGVLGVLRLVCLLLPGGLTMAVAWGIGRWRSRVGGALAWFQVASVAAGVSFLTWFVELGERVWSGDLTVLGLPWALAPLLLPLCAAALGQRLFKPTWPAAFGGGPLPLCLGLLSIPLIAALYRLIREPFNLLGVDLGPVLGQGLVLNLCTWTCLLVLGVAYARRGGTDAGGRSGPLWPLVLWGLALIPELARSLFDGWLPSPAGLFLGDWGNVLLF